MVCSGSVISSFKVTATTLPKCNVVNGQAHEVRRADQRVYLSVMQGAWGTCGELRGHESEVVYRLGRFEHKVEVTR